ncbi:MAG TPA: c-type cytochrome domain-containing protein [Gemmataceae bacterium]|nr:c-type cytochrome domain-containing protein [Gemmataceae bacterium]
MSCHGSEKQRGGLRIDRKADALTGGGVGAPYPNTFPNPVQTLPRATVPRQELSSRAGGHTANSRTVSALGCIDGCSGAEGRTVSSWRSGSRSPTTCSCSGRSPPLHRPVARYEPCSCISRRSHAPPRPARTSRPPRGA